METRFELIVPPDAAKMRLEDYLLDEFAAVSKMYLRELVKSERCEVNGRYENVGYRLRPNDLVEIWMDETRGTAMRPEKLNLDILFEDAEIAVVNKPAGMLVHPSHRENRGTLLNGLVWHFNEQASIDVRTKTVRPGLIHRLDKQTSGLLVVAKTARAHRIVSGHFMKKRVEKRYLALVEGIVSDDEGVIDAPIGRFAELKHWSVKEDGKHSRSHFWVRDRRADTTLLELEPVTGRTNQLRIHCELIGHPIVGDVKRGGRNVPRLYLHAVKLAFPHPTTNRNMRFESEPKFPLLTGCAR
ncbi:MAG TPA: RluA family pseudouridine synthase [Pyrinomonadaceae bacterium]|nr:RluA family pseudouridine synthase [Pyrinomonadaceae bacterium]